MAINIETFISHPAAEKPSPEPLPISEEEATKALRRKINRLRRSIPEKEDFEILFTIRHDKSEVAPLKGGRNWRSLDRGILHRIGLEIMGDYGMLEQTYRQLYDIADGELTATQVRVYDTYYDGLFFQRELTYHKESGKPIKLWWTAIKKPKGESK